MHTCSLACLLRVNGTQLTRIKTAPSAAAATMYAIYVTIWHNTKRLGNRPPSLLCTLHCTAFLSSAPPYSRNEVQIMLDIHLTRNRTDFVVLELLLASLPKENKIGYKLTSIG